MEPKNEAEERAGTLSFSVVDASPNLFFQLEQEKEDSSRFRSCIVISQGHFRRKRVLGFDKKTAGRFFWNSLRETFLAVEVKTGKTIKGYT